MTQPSRSFCQAWEEGRLHRPVILLIGGYAGTGKSTLAARLSKRLTHAQTIPTGIFRSIAQTQTTPRANAALFLPTYDLHTLQDTPAGIIRAFGRQCRPVTTSIKSVITFMAVEKQHLIIEGNHVLPWEDYAHEGCSVIELYLYVKDPTQHQRMLGGPTHNRTISSKQFQTGRAIHDMLCAEAAAHHKALFECSELTAAEAYFEQQLAAILKRG